MNIQSISRNDITFALLLLGFAVCFYGRYILTGNLMLPQALPSLSGVVHPENANVRWDALQWDCAAQYLPWRHAAKRMFKRNRIPLWNPWQGCGMPLLANPQVGVFYPMNMPLWFMPIEVAGVWLALLHTMIAALSTYSLSRVLGIAPLGGFACAISYSFCAPLITWQMLPTAFYVMCWLPCAMLCLILCFRRKTPIRFICLAGTCTMLILAGHPQACAYSFIAIFITSLLMSSLLVRRCGIGAALLNIAIVIFAMALSICISSLQLFPTIELARHSHRSGAPTWDGYLWFASRGMRLEDFAMLLLPYAWGKPQLGTYIGKENFADYCPYVGIITLLLAGVVVILRRRSDLEDRAASFLAACLLLLGIALSTGSAFNVPFYFAVPGFAQFGTPARSWFIGALGIALMCGIGIGRIQMCEPKMPGMVRRTLALAALLMLCVCTSCFGVAMGWSKLIHIEFADAVSTLAAWNWFVIMVLIALLAAIPFFRIGLRFIAHLAPVALAFELLAFGLDYNQALRRNEYEEFKAGLSALSRKLVSLSNGLYRALPISASWGLRKMPRALLPPNLMTLGELYDPQAYDSLLLRSCKALMEAVEGAHPCPPENGNMILLRNVASPLLKQLAVRYLLVRLSGHAAQASWRRIEQLDDVQVCEISGALMRVWIPKCIEVRTNGNEVLSALKGMGEKDINSAFVVCPSAEFRLSLNGWLKCVALQDEGALIMVSMKGTGGRALVLSDMFYPGWRATLLTEDAKVIPLTIYPAQYALRCVFIPKLSDKPKSCSLIFAYLPTSYLLGLFITFVSASFVIGLVCFRLSLTCSMRRCASQDSSTVERSNRSTASASNFNLTVSGRL